MVRIMCDASMDEIIEMWTNVEMKKWFETENVITVVWSS
jgi:hypothetical protein